MTRYDHLIVGGGMSADAAAHGIREQDPDATIGIHPTAAEEFVTMRTPRG